MLNKIVKWITNNFGLKILAVVFASVLWLAVVNIDDPNTTRSFTTTVSVENADYLTGIGKYYEILNNSNTVTFKVSGKRSYLERMANVDFRAVADLERIENFNKVPIEIVPQRYNGYVTVSSKVYYLEVEVEDLISKPFVISVETEGDAAEQHAIGDTSVSPTLLRVSGPASIVNSVDRAVATVNVEEMSEDITDSVIPVLYDKEGHEVNTQDLSFNIQNVMVSVKILDTKEVTLNFQTSGTLPEGYAYVGIEYHPQTVLVKGVASVLNTVNSIAVPREVLDLTDATGNLETEVDISSYLPGGVSLVESSQSKISVVVKIEKHETRKFAVPTANITVSNLSGRYGVEFLTDTVEVELEGLSSELEALDAATLTGSIDVAGMTEGEHTVNLALNLDSKYKLVKNATVAVDIVLASGRPSMGADTEDSDEGGSGGNQTNNTNNNNNSEEKDTAEADSEATDTNTGGSAGKPSPPANSED